MSRKVVALNEQPMSVVEIIFIGVIVNFIVSRVRCFVLLLNRCWGIIAVPGSFLKAGDLRHSAPRTQNLSSPKSRAMIGGNKDFFTGGFFKKKKLWKTMHWQPKCCKLSQSTDRNDSEIQSNCRQP